MFSPLVRQVAQAATIVSWVALVMIFILTLMQLLPLLVLLVGIGFTLVVTTAAYLSTLLPTWTMNRIVERAAERHAHRSFHNVRKLIDAAPPEGRVQLHMVAMVIIAAIGVMAFITLYSVARGPEGITPLPERTREADGAVMTTVVATQWQTHYAPGPTVRKRSTVTVTSTPTATPTTTPTSTTPPSPTPPSPTPAPDAVPTASDSSPGRSPSNQPPGNGRATTTTTATKTTTSTATSTATPTTALSPSPSEQGLLRSLLGGLLR